jgi:hypothetical protein
MNERFLSIRPLLNQKNWFVVEASKQIDRDKHSESWKNIILFFDEIILSM